MSRVELVGSYYDFMEQEGAGLVGEDRLARYSAALDGQRRAIAEQVGVDVDTLHSMPPHEIVDALQRRNGTRVIAAAINT